MREVGWLGRVIGESDGREKRPKKEINLLGSKNAAVLDINGS